MDQGAGGGVFQHPQRAIGAFFHIADAVLHPLHLEHPAWRNAFDLVQGQAAETRRTILDRAATDRTKILAYHFPFPTLGHIVARGLAWAWEPIA